MTWTVRNCELELSLSNRTDPRRKDKQDWTRASCDYNSFQRWVPEYYSFWRRFSLLSTLQYLKTRTEFTENKLQWWVNSKCTQDQRQYFGLHEEVFLYITASVKIMYGDLWVKNVFFNGLKRQIVSKHGLFRIHISTKVLKVFLKLKMV